MLALTDHVSCYPDSEGNEEVETADQSCELNVQNFRTYWKRVFSSGVSTLTLIHKM